MTLFNILWWIMLLLYIPAAVALITIVLLQKGKGAGFAGAFGMGSGSETVFGPRLARTLPQKLTYASAAIFMLLALSMSMISGKTSRGVAPELVEETDITQQQIDQLLDESIDGAVTVPATETTTSEMPLVVAPEVAVSEDGTTESVPAPAEAPVSVDVLTPGAPVEGIPVVVEDTLVEEAAPVEAAAPVETAPVDAAPVEAAAPVETAPVEEAAPAEEPAVQ